MKCVNCGAYIEDSSKFCSYCGTPNSQYVPKAHPAEQYQAQPQTQPEPQRQPVINVNINHSENQRVDYTRKEGKRTMYVSDKNRLVLLLLIIFVGGFGIHKFYSGKIGMGILYLFTFGIFGIGVIVDFFVALFGNPKDKYGYPIRW